MIGPLEAATPNTPDAPEERLRQVAHQMEGVFLGHLLQALRETVPAEGLMARSSGEDMFTALMDERLAQAAADQQDRGLGAVLFRQLRAALAASPETRS